MLSNKTKKLIIGFLTPILLLSSLASAQATGIKVTETVTGTLSNGESIKGLSHTKTYDPITSVVEQSFPVPNAAVATLVTVGAAVAGGTLTAINYFAFKNEDAAITITLGLVSASDTAYIKVGPGEFIEIIDGTIDTNTDAGVVSTFIALTSINAKAASGTPKASYIAF